jgi:hypothetical protein
VSERMARLVRRVAIERGMSELGASAGRTPPRRWGAARRRGGCAMAAARRGEAAAGCRRLLPLLLLVVPAACERAQITGTLHAGPGEDVYGAVVIACHAPEGRCDPASPHSRSVHVRRRGAEAPFRISRLGGRAYILVGFQDRNGNGIEDEGDRSGHHARPGGGALLLSPPHRGAVVRLGAVEREAVEERARAVPGVPESD